MDVLFKHEINYMLQNLCWGLQYMYVGMLKMSAKAVAVRKL